MSKTITRQFKDLRGGLNTVLDRTQLEPADDAPVPTPAAVNVLGRSGGIETRPGTDIFLDLGSNFELYTITAILPWTPLLGGGGPTGGGGDGGVLIDGEPDDPTDGDPILILPPPPPPPPPPVEVSFYLESPSNGANVSGPPILSWTFPEVTNAPAGFAAYFKVWTVDVADENDVQGPYDVGSSTSLNLANYAAHYVAGHTYRWTVLAVIIFNETGGDDLIVGTAP